MKNYGAQQLQTSRYSVTCSIIGHNISWIIIYFRAESSACTWFLQRVSQTRHCSRPSVPLRESPRPPSAWRASRPRSPFRPQLACPSAACRAEARPRQAAVTPSASKVRPQIGLARGTLASLGLTGVFEGDCHSSAPALSPRSRRARAWSESSTTSAEPRGRHYRRSTSLSFAQPPHMPRPPSSFIHTTSYYVFFLRTEEPRGVMSRVLVLL